MDLTSWAQIPGAPALYLAFQAFQVVVFWISGDAVQAAGAWAFGPWMALALGWAGTFVGTSAAFALGRRLGAPRVLKWIPRPWAPAFQGLMAHPRFDRLVGLVFFLPFVPKDLLCYVAGLSRIRAWKFLALAAVGRLPGLVLVSFAAEGLGQHPDWLGLAGGVLAACGLVALVVGPLVRRALAGAKKGPASWPVQLNATSWI